MSLTLAELLARSSMLELALTAGLKAACLLEAAWLDGRALDVRDKGRHDLVTQIDQESESLIRECLSAGAPEIGLLGEEGGGQVDGCERFWVVDPLDGTSNFVHGYPAFAVSIGLLERAGAGTTTGRGRFPQVAGCKSRLGVIVDVCQRQLFLAAAGMGAWRLRVKSFEGQPAGSSTLQQLTVGGKERISDAFLATGFPIRHRDLALLYLNLFDNIMPRSGGLRRGGSAALDMAYTAAGIFDGFFELNLSPWDIAAGICLVEEAGGQVQGLWGDPLADGHLVAGNARLVGEILASGR